MESLSPLGSRFGLLIVRSAMAFFMSVALLAGGCGALGSDSSGLADFPFGRDADGKVWAFTHNDGQLFVEHSDESSSESWPLSEIAVTWSSWAMPQFAIVDQIGRPWFVAWYRLSGTEVASTVAVYKDGQWKEFSSNEIGCERVTGLELAPDSTVWAFGDPECVAFYDDNRGWLPITQEHSLPGPWILWMDVGPDGTVWIAGYRSHAKPLDPEAGGWLASWNGVEWAHHDALPDGFPQDLAFDGDNGVWASFAPEWDRFEGGLAHFDGTRWDLRFDETGGLQSNRVGRLLLDETGGVWIVYGLSPTTPFEEPVPGAVSYLQDGLWRHWTEVDGLPGGNPVDRCSALAPCQAADDLYRQGIWQTTDGAVVVELMHICGSGKGSHCVGGGWAQFDGSRWIDVGEPSTLTPTSIAGTAPSTTLPRRPTTSVTTITASSMDTSTTATTTTTEPPAIEPSPPLASFVVDLTNVLEPPPEPGSGGALGSGCAPGTNILPDGIWAGWVVERDPDQVQFDLACMYAGPEEPGLQNQSNRTRSIPVSTSTVVYTIDEGVMYGTPVPYAQWQVAPISVFCADVMITPSFPSGCPVWLYVNDGVATEITEFFLP